MNKSNNQKAFTYTSKVVMLPDAKYKKLCGKIADLEKEIAELKTERNMLYYACTDKSKRIDRLEKENENIPPQNSINDKPADAENIVNGRFETYRRCDNGELALVKVYNNPDDENEDITNLKREVIGLKSENARLEKRIGRLER